jgi:hypothetical protein
MYTKVTNSISASTYQLACRNILTTAAAGIEPPAFENKHFQVTNAVIHGS